ncbi:hypothetical protein [Fictibacillus phosphorivorans]|uniref:hypothetical protein n=1 Tax=Fictibacillus phosphorivorans TaxID=1221500 RepID=UPI0012E7FD80|nr:hypothetical protein [Fictibacillus phosphorivorans]
MLEVDDLCFRVGAFWEDSWSRRELVGQTVSPLLGVFLIFTVRVLFIITRSLNQSGFSLNSPSVSLNNPFVSLNPTAVSLRTLPVSLTNFKICIFHPI